MCLDCFVLRLPGNSVGERFNADRVSEGAAAPVSEAAASAAPGHEAAPEPEPDDLLQIPCEERQPRGSPAPVRHCCALRIATKGQHDGTYGTAATLPDAHIPSSEGGVAAGIVGRLVTPFLTKSIVVLKRVWSFELAPVGVLALRRPAFRPAPRTLRIMAPASPKKFNVTGGHGVVRDSAPTFVVSALCSGPHSAAAARD